jgi:hypothetical protein
LEWAPGNGVTAVTVTGKRIDFGTGEKLEQKIKIVQALIKQSGGVTKDWTVLDVRSVDRPSLKR